MQLLFWVTLGLVAASYFFYPALVFILGRINHFTVHKDDIEPGVSVVISAFNEGKDIQAKLQNTLALDYPRDKIEILVGSDGSQDETATFVREFESEGIRFFEFKENRGKTAVQNDLVQAASHDLLIFTDAASFLPENALKKMVPNFADPRVGCVAGKMRFIDTDRNLTTRSQGIYWRYEVKVRELESAMGSLVGVDGPLYAVRRENYVPLAPNIISDLMTPLLVLGQRRKVVLEPEAFVDEEPKEKSDEEFSTRRRITLRGMVGVFSHARLLDPFQYPLLSFQILFHKVVRWNVGLLVLINFLATLILARFTSFYQLVLMCYGAFGILALLGWLAASRGFSIKGLSIPYYFFLVNLAAGMGVLDYLQGKQAVTWKTVR